MESRTSVVLRKTSNFTFTEKWPFTARRFFRLEWRFFDVFFLYHVADWSRGRRDDFDPRGRGSITSLPRCDNKTIQNTRSNLDIIVISCLFFLHVACCCRRALHMRCLLMMLMLLIILFILIYLIYITFHVTVICAFLLLLSFCVKFNHHFCFNQFF